MKITVNTEEARELGCMKAVILGYFREYPDIDSLDCVEDLIGICEGGLRHQLCDLEAMGYVKKTYGVPFKHKPHGRIIKSVEVLK